MASTGNTGAGEAAGLAWDRMMAAAQAGDAEAYRTLLAELVIWLRRYYARRLPPAMTEDAVQDVLLAVHEKRHTYDPSRAFGPWLAAIARYKWIDRLRALRANAAEPLDESIGIPDHGGTASPIITSRAINVVAHSRAEGQVGRRCNTSKFLISFGSRAASRLRGAQGG